MRPVIIMGMCRSGTSAVSEACHWLGYAMAAGLGYPAPGVGRPEWEDSSFTAQMAMEFPALSPAERVERAVSHVEHRIQMAGLYGVKRVGFKSPLYSLYYTSMVKALAMCGLKAPVLLRSVRNLSGIEASIDRQVAAAQPILRSWNEEIAFAKRPGWAVDVSYGDLIELPDTIVGQLANLLEVYDPVLIGRAVSNIRQPI